MDKKYFCAYHSYSKSIEPLNDAERGRLFTALLEYSETGIAPKLSGNEKYVFPTIRAQIDRDAIAYEDKCKTNAENGKKGGRPKTEQKRKNPTVILETEKTQREGKGEREGEGKGEGKGEKKDKVLSSDSTTRPREDGFDAFWAEYPKKNAKKDALKAWEKLKPNDETVKQILDGVRRWSKSEQWKKDSGQYIPLPATFLRGERWKDAVTIDSGKNYSTGRDFFSG